MNLRPISDQVVVITGASSGIGLATARLAAERGAAVVLSSRNEEELQNIVESWTSRGLRCTYAVADVAQASEMDNVAKVALDTFGRIDTWINNAGVMIIGKLADSHLDEKRRLFEINFWGVVHGCRTALPLLRENGGAIINIGSIESERAVPLHGIYAASKHAVKAYTDALRMEIEHDKLPVSVTLIKPASIDTPILEHARVNMETRPKNPGPIYSPDVAAEQILYCAEHKVRDAYVGGSTQIYSILEKYAPRLCDFYMEKVLFRQIPTEKEKHSKDQEALFDAPAREGFEHGDEERRVRSTSLYTNLNRHKVLSGLGTLAALGAAGFAIRRLSQRHV